MISDSHQQREDVHRHTPPKYLQCKREQENREILIQFAEWYDPEIRVAVDKFLKERR